MRTATVIVILGVLSFCDQQLSDYLTKHSDFQVKNEHYETKHGNANPNLKLKRKDVGNTCAVSLVCHSAGPSTEDLIYFVSWRPVQLNSGGAEFRVILHIVTSGIAFNSCWVFCSIFKVRVLARSQRVTDSADHSQSEV